MNHWDEGLAVRRAVLGDAHVDRALAEASLFTGAWQEYITSAAWGRIWARPGLDRRTRSLLTVALLTALRCEGELPMHVRAAIGNGVTAAELQETLLHTAVYAGVPAANSAFTIAQRVLAELGVDEAATPYGSGASTGDPGTDGPEVSP